jgi:SAM-dependent methyltransferase
LIFLGDLDPDAIGPNLEYATHYEATPLADAARIFEALPIPPENAGFVDIGSGMGRIVLLAARLPFRQVLGIELSGALHAVAQDNLAAFPESERRCRDVRLKRSDAATARYPSGDLVVYLYNPFRAAVLEPVIARLLTRDPAHELVVAYHTPLERALIEATGAFEVAADLGFAVVYRRVSAAPHGARARDSGRPRLG